MRTHRLLIAACLLSATAHAATINSTWSGGATGDWSTPANWTPNGVPNNNGVDFYNVNIPSPSAVNVNGQFTIQIFDLDAGASALLPAGLLTLNANSILDGLLQMGVDGNFATGRLALASGVTLSGAGTIELLGSSSIEGGPATIGSGITILTGTGGPGALIDSDLTAAGPVDINNAGFTVNFGRTFTVSGPLDLAADARLHAIGATVVLQNNTTQVAAGSEINGGVTLNGATVNGSGSIRPQTFNLFGTNTFNATIDTDQTTVIANGAAILNGSGSLIGDGTPLNAAAPGATLTFGASFNLGGSLTINLPTRLQGQTITSGVFTIASDLENDGTLEVNGTSVFRVNANANVIAGSTGTINIGPDASLEVTGPATLGGAFSVSGDFIFKPGVTLVVGDWDGDGTSEMNLQSGGTTATFSQEVGNVGHLTVPSNGTASFNGGLQTLGSATLNGSTAVFGVTGDTTVTGLFQVQNGAIHRGSGTTTTQGDLEFSGKLDGRTLVAQGPTKGQQLTLQNNALFVNEGTYSFFSFGPPATVAGSGIFRNSGTLTQVANGFSEFIPSNTISSEFEQTAEGNLVPVSTIQLTGNSTIGGTITIPENATLSFGAAETDTTHTVSADTNETALLASSRRPGGDDPIRVLNGEISGDGKLEAKGNPTTGAKTQLKLNGRVNLTGPNSGTTVGPGAKVEVQLSGSMPTSLGQKLEVETDDIDLPAEIEWLAPLIGGSGPPMLYTVIEMKNGRLTADVPASSTPVSVLADDVVLVGINLLDNIALEAANIFLRDVLELRKAQLAIAQGEAQAEAGSQIKSPTGDGSVSVANGGTLVIQGNPGDSSPAVAIETPVGMKDGALIVQPGATLNVEGETTVESCTLEILIDGKLIIEEITITQSTITAKSGSGDDKGGTLVVDNAVALKDSTLNVESGAEATVTLGTTRDEVENFTTNLDENGRAFLNQFLKPDANVALEGSGTVALRDLVNVGVQPGQSAGRLHITGDLPLGAGSDITIEIGGTTAITQHDVLAVTGQLDVSAVSLRVLLIENFQSSITSTDAFTVIETTEPIVGNFANVFNGRLSTADGSFSVTFTENRTRVVLGDFISAPDADSDGMSDAFETQYGLNPNDPADAAADSDNDGEDNLAEFRAETAPTDANSITRSGRTLNISTRLRVLTGENVLIGGYIITGEDPKEVIVRSLGPSLAAAGVPDTLVNPTLELFDSAGNSVAFNDDWKETQQAEIEATTIPPTDDLEAAIVRTLDPGAYTAVVSGADGGTGVALVEVYDLTGPPAKLANISTRGFVDAGDNVMIGGFIIGGGLGVNGSGSARFLARALGPSLANAGVPNALQDPTLEVFNGNGDLIAGNDNWGSMQQAEIEATTIPPSNELEAAVVAVVPAGPYTAVVRGANNGTGVGLIEVYNLNP